MLYRFLAVLGLALVGIAAPAPGWAQQADAGEPASTKPDLMPARHFAALPVFGEAELSPNGQKISFVRDTQGVAELVVADPVSGQTLTTMFMPGGFSVRTYRWLDNTRMLVTATGIIRTEKYYYRVRQLYIVDPAAGKADALIEDPFVSSSARVIHVADDGSFLLVAHRHDPKAKYPSVYRYDLGDAVAGRYVQPPIDGVVNWSADDTGVVRLGLGRRKNRLQIWYRGSAADPLAKIADVPQENSDELFDSLLRISRSNQGYVIDEGSSGRQGLHLYDFDQRRIVETIYENPDWDVEDVIFEDGKPLAATYIDDARRIVWFDEENRALYNDLKAALGGERTQVWIMSRSKDNRRMLIWAGHESDPGVLYFFDRDRQAMSELAQYRPKVDFRKLAQPKPIAYSARDGTSIRGYLTLPRGREPVGLPLIVMPHGGPFGVRDRLQYSDDVQLLANRGYAVLQPNFRGSGGYGDDFYELGEGEVGRKMQDDLDDAMDWAVGEGIADPERVCVIGGSYGGYAAMWAVLRNPERYRCAASWAGVTDWDRVLRYDRKFLSRKGRREWRAKIEGEANFDLAKVSPARLGNRLTRPVLLAHGTDDDVVPFKQFEQMVEASKNAPVPPTTLIVHRAGHSFSKSRDRELWFDALDLFLAEHNPADQVDANGEFRKPRDEELDGMFKPLVIKPVSNDAD